MTGVQTCALPICQVHEEPVEPDPHPPRGRHPVFHRAQVVLVHTSGLLVASGAERGLRIDHLLLSADLAPRLIDAGVDRWVRDQEHASDHAPTWVTLNGEVSGKAAPEKPAKRSKAKTTK